MGITALSPTLCRTFGHTKWEPIKFWWLVPTDLTSRAFADAAKQLTGKAVGTSEGSNRYIEFGVKGECQITWDILGFHLFPAYTETLKFRVRLMAGSDVIAQAGFTWDDDGFAVLNDESE